MLGFKTQCLTFIDLLISHTPYVGGGYCGVRVCVCMCFCVVCARSFNCCLACRCGYIKRASNRNITQLIETVVYCE